MVLNAYTIYDCKSLQYHSPWFAATDGAATRMLADLVNDMQTTLGRHPRDYALYRCGQWDDNKGTFTPEYPVVHIVDAVALIVDRNQAELPLTQERDQAILAARTVEEVRAVMANGKGK